MSSVIRRGYTPRGAGAFLKIKPDDSVVIAPLQGLDEVVSVDLHGFWEVNPAVLVPCLRRNCPACDIGDKPSLRAYIPVRTRDGDVQVLSAGPMILRQLAAISEELEGGIKGKVLKINRSGSGLGTRYTVIPLGKTADISDAEMPDVIAMIAPVDRNGIVQKLADAGYVDNPEDYMEAVEHEDTADAVEDGEANSDEPW